MTDQATAYAESVITGKRAACKWERMACQRHIDDQKRGVFYWDEVAAGKAIKFFAQLRHYKGAHAGHSFELQPSQQFMIGSIYGWKTHEGGPRRFRYAYIEIPRKQGKTTMSAGVGIMGILEEPGAEVYSVATKEDQAKIGWRDGRAMIKGSPGLTEMLSMRVKEIRFDNRESIWRPLGSDSETLDGLNPSLALMDELHAWSSRDLWDVIDDGMGARLQPMIFQITTAGSNKFGICMEQRRHTCSILEGTVTDDHYFGIIFTIDEGDDPHDPATWHKANPLLGVAKTLEFMQQQSDMAKMLPGKLNAFLNKQLNVWTEQEVRWLSPHAWDDCAGEIEESSLVGESCVGGLDMAATTDISALVRYFPSSTGAPDIIVPTFWIPEDTIQERSRRDRVPYDQWAKEGIVRATPGNVVDYDRVRADILEMHEQTPFIELAYDPWNLTQLATQLQGDGVVVVPFRQGFASMSPAAKELEKRLLGKTMNHGGNQVLRWMAGNVAIEQDAAGNIKPSKRKSTERIDGIVALTMAIGRQMVQGGATTGGFSF
jgi:phage terminase large subunit-like protein